MKKILMLLEHVRVEHVFTDPTTKNGYVDYLRTDMGKLLKKKMKSAGIDIKSIDIQYMYEKVPEVKTVNPRTKKPMSYKDVPYKDTLERRQYLEEMIVVNEYDMIIPTGNLGCKFLLDRAAITKLRGVPVEKTITHASISEHTTYIFPMYSMEYISFKKNEEILYDADLGTLKSFYEEGAEVFIPKKVGYDTLYTIQEVEDYFNFLHNEKPLTSWDLETNTFYGYLEGAKALVISISHEEAQGVTIPLEHKAHQWKPEERERLFELVEQYVTDAELTKVLQNGMFDMTFMMNAYGIYDFKNNLDTKIAYYLAVSQEESKSFKLTDLAYEFTDMGGYDKDLEDWKKQYISEYKKEHKDSPVNEVDGSNFNYEWFPFEDMLSPYASGDVDCCRRIHVELWKKIEQDPEWIYLYTDFYPRFSVALAKMQANGFAMDMEYLDDLMVEYPKEMEKILLEIREDPFVKQLEEENRGMYEIGLQEWAKPKAERDPELAKLRNKYKNKLEFSPTSAAEKGRLLYDIIGAEPPITSKTLKDSAKGKPKDRVTWEDYKTDKDNVNWVKDNVPEAKELCEVLLRFSKATTLYSTFVKGLREKVHAEARTVHGSFNITGTDTSRLSSSGPNFQNIPSSTQKMESMDYRYPIKRIFTTRFEEGTIIQADYSALEMRILGLAAGDQGITKTLLEKKDIHTNTASMAFNKPESEVTSDERSAAKTVGFGIIYGQHPTSLAPQLGMTEDEAIALFETFYRNKPDVKQFMDGVHQFLEKNGYVRTMQGHKRILRDIWTNGASKNGALRQSVNTVIQGTGAFITNFAVTLIHEYLEYTKKKSLLVSTVHDSIVLDCPPEEVVEVADTVKYIMENLPVEFLMFDWEGQRMRYPIVADVDVGTNYKDLAVYDKELYKEFKSTKGYVKYHKDLGLIEDTQANKRITKEQAEQAKEFVKANIEYYKGV